MSHTHEERPFSSLCWNTQSRMNSHDRETRPIMDLEGQFSERYAFLVTSQN